MINRGEWKKIRKKSKIGQKLHEFKRIGTILENFIETSEIFFQKS